MPTMPTVSDFRAALEQLGSGNLNGHKIARSVEGLRRYVGNFSADDPNTAAELDARLAEAVKRLWRATRDEWLRAVADGGEAFSTAQTRWDEAAAALRELMPADAYHALVKAAAAVPDPLRSSHKFPVCLQSERLADTLWLYRTDDELALVPPGEAAYHLSDIPHLRHLHARTEGNDEHLRAVHESMKLFPGTRIKADA